jgi:uncharacterized FlaG/YvyC family protein
MNDDISGTGQFAGLGSADPVPAYKPPEVSTRPAAPAPDASRSSARAAAGKAPTSEEIAAAVSSANANLASSNRSLEYRVDAATGISIAMIRNTQTGAVMQQIPGADIIALARMLADWAPGKHMLLDLIA